MPAKAIAPEGTRNEQFQALFLSAADLPAMTCVRDARVSDVAPPSDGPKGHGWKRAGWAVWFAPADSEVYRVDDVRWLFNDEARSRKWYDVLRSACADEAPAVPPVVGPGVSAVASGAPVHGFSHLIHLGCVVMRVKATAGEGAVMSRDAAARLAEAALTRSVLFLTNHSPEPTVRWWAPAPRTPSGPGSKDYPPQD